MELKDSLKLFSKVTGDFKVVLLAKQSSPTGRRIDVKDDLPILDALDLLLEHDCLVTEHGLVVTRTEAMERPVRILFYMLITELEYSLYKILKQYLDSEETLEALRTYQINDMIREFVKSDNIIRNQNIYKTKQEMKRDLKAVSSFRNIVMHSNRKMELETEFEVILERKNQLFRLLDAMGQIMDKVKAEKGRWV